MGKMGKAKVVVITVAATAIVIGGAIVTKLNNWLGDNATPNWPDGPGSGDELTEWPGPGSGDELIVRSSCNVIVDKSTCLDYLGNYWKNDNHAKLNCYGVGFWSKNHCPKDYIGGCAINYENDQEMISWHYAYGNAAYDSESAKYAAMACNTNPASTWITINY